MNRQSAAGDKNSNASGTSRVFILSQRNINLMVYQCYIYEFEDVISGVDSVDLLAPTSSISSPADLFMHRAANRTRKTFGLSPQSEIVATELERNYELFFAVFQFPRQIAMMKKIKGWRSRCRKAACIISEVWTKDLPASREYIRLLSEFDQVFVPSQVSVEPMSELLGRQCQMLSPFAVDMVRFCPYPALPERLIDVLSVGRYSPVLHRGLRELAEQDELFYYYDTVHNFSVSDWKDHRIKFASMLKRSRYFLAYKLNVNKKEVTGGDEALTTRLYEGAGAGAVVLGIPPACNEYLDHFDWPDAMISIPYEPSSVTQLLSELDAQPERLARIRRDNVVNSLLRHDWVHRWARVLESVGLPQTEAMIARRVELEARANQCRSIEPWIPGERKNDKVRLHAKGVSATVQ